MDVGKAVSKSTDDLIYSNHLFKEILPKFFHFALPQIGLAISNKSVLSILSVLLPVIALLALIKVILVIRWILNLRRSIKQPFVYLEVTPPSFTEKSAYTTSELFKTIHGLVFDKTFMNKLLGLEGIVSCELVSTLNQGIRYVIRTTPDQINTLKRNIYSYLPQGNIKVIDDYLPLDFDKLNNQYSKTVEFKLTRPFAYPLQRQDYLKENDPISYITGQMTKLSKGELISLQVILSPTKSGDVKNIERHIKKGDVLEYLNQREYPLVLKVLGLIITGLVIGVKEVIGGLAQVISEAQLDPESLRRYRAYEMESQRRMNIKLLREYTPFELEVVHSIQEKVREPLFKTTVRLLIIGKDKHEVWERISSVANSFGQFTSTSGQELKLKKNLFDLPLMRMNIRHFLFRQRLLSLFPQRSDKYAQLLSVSEVSDLYHFPFKNVTQTENIAKIYSGELPAPLSLKNGTKLDVVFAKNTYGGSTTEIGVTKTERTGHFYIIGQTRSGKSNLILQKIIQDIQAGRTVILIDPHGDLAKAVINFIAEERINDFIYISPRDIKHPVGMNLLELSKVADEDELEIEKDIVAEGTISIMRKVFASEFSKGDTNAFRIESILRNTIHTAFLTDDPTLFTIFDLLNNPEIRSKALQRVTDRYLMDFWREEFGNAGDWARVKKVSPVNARIGRFLFSPILKRIMEQKKSTINFDEVLNKGKILVCNLAKGEITEDNCVVLGTLILTKIRQAAEKRALMEYEERTPVYLYIDEFQNFATPSFMKMLSELGKFGINIIIVEQSTSQQVDRSQTETLLANVGNVITFKTANPIDEDLMLRQFSPQVKRGEIPNLPRYHFYMKKGAVEPEEPFSGTTDPVKFTVDKEKVGRFIQRSRDNYAIIYKRPEPVPVTTNAKATKNGGSSETGSGKPKTPKEEPKDVKNTVIKPASYIT